MEKQLKPSVEKEIKEGFFEIRKKFGGTEPINGEEVQVYVSHLCLFNYHPIFCKFSIETVKCILNSSQIIYLKRAQTLFSPGYNDRYLYIVLFGKLQLYQGDTGPKVGQTINIGWTVGEEILFKSDKQQA
jgi:CRP-like cAMP-binding protein